MLGISLDTGRRVGDREKDRIVQLLVTNIKRPEKLGLSSGPKLFVLINHLKSNKKRTHGWYSHVLTPCSLTSHLFGSVRVQLDLG